MTTIPSMAGTLQMAAALVFHLPGARLDLSSADGVTCSVGPLTDPRCVLHPAEFRDLVVTTGGAIDTIAVVPGALFSDAPSLSLTIAMPGVQHIGCGLYRITGDHATSYAFVTPLLPSVVDAVMTDMKADLPVDYQCGKLPPSDELGSSHHDGEAIAVNLIQDEGLGVTMVVMYGVDTRDEVDEEIARSAVSACLVAELEYAVRGVC